MYVLSSLIRELTGNCWAKGEDKIDHGTVSRKFKEFRMGCKDLDDQARSGMPKTVLQATETILANDTWRVSCELGIS